MKILSHSGEKNSFLFVRLYCTFFLLLFAKLRIANFITPVRYKINLFCVSVAGCSGNPDAKRLYDDLLSNYNKLVRPVVNVTDALTVKIKLKLSQLIDVVSFIRKYFLSSYNKFVN